MKTSISVKKEVEVKTLIVSAGVRYWEDATVNGVEDEDGSLIPCREGEYWCPEIDLDTGVITNWIQGVTADIHYKVCDDGNYRIADADGNVVFEKEGYVVDMMCPEENGYGDYIIMKVDESGRIANWKPSLEGFDQSITREM